MKIYYPLVPVSFYEDLTLVYDYCYTKPIKHFKFTPQLTESLKRIVIGIYQNIPEEIAEKLKNLGIIGEIIIPIKKSNFDIIVLDFSIGGPSLWGKNVYHHLYLKKKSTIYFSYSRREFIIDSENIRAENRIKHKVEFINIARQLVNKFEYKKILIIGRDCAARMIDILDQKKSIILETGYGESIIRKIEKLNREEEKQIVDELLFRENMYPWDSFSNAYAHSQCLQHYKSIMWSEQKVKYLQEKFPTSDISFHPPNMFFSPTDEIRENVNNKIRIIVGLGNHQTGENSIKFLNLMPLFSIAKMFEDELTISIICKEEGNINNYISSKNIEVRRYSSQQQFFELLKNTDLYYRVQNDNSIPISVIEAMFNRSVGIISESCKNTWTKLKDFENIVFVQHGSVESLKNAIKKLLMNKKDLIQIKNNSHSTVKRFCNAEDYIKNMKLS